MPGLHLCYDCDHGNLDEHNIQFAGRLGSIHAHDNDQLADIHGALGDPVVGSIDWDQELGFLKSTVFAGPFGIYVGSEKIVFLREKGVLGID